MVLRRMAGGGAALAVLSVAEGLLVLGNVRIWKTSNNRPYHFPQFI